MFAIWLCLLSVSCSRPSSNPVASGQGNAYSEGFSLRQYSDFTLLTVTSPWQNAGDAGFNWVLERKAGSIPDSLKNFPVIPVPVKKVVVFSTTHIGFISALHEERSIKGVSGFGYVFNPEVRERIREGKVADVGYAPAVDYEAIMAMHPDIVFLYGLNASVTGISERLAKAGIPSVIIAEYLESHPLGKMEWLKVFAAFYDREALADSLFIEAEKTYRDLEKTALDTETKPRILAGLPWKDTWYMAGGRSFMARLIHDAGGDYLWKDNPSDEYIPLDLETAFLKAFNADCWINTGSAQSLDAIAARDERFGNLPVFRNGRVYNNDARLSPGGGNDYWESGVVSPEKILADLIEIFHPGLLPQHQFVYYRKLE